MSQIPCPECASCGLRIRDGKKAEVFIWQKPERGKEGFMWHLDCYQKIIESMGGKDGN